MANTGLTSELLADIKLKMLMPEDQATFSNADILDIAYKEMTTVCYPKVMKFREGFFSAVKRYTLASTRRYRMPPRAVGNKVWDIIIDDGERRSINQVNRFVLSRREGFYIDGSDIVLTDAAPTSGTMIVTYPLRPLPFTTTTGNALTAVTAGASITTGNVADDVMVDIQSAESPFGIAVPAVLLTNGVGSINTDQNPQVGDLAVLGSFYVPLPLELHDWLAHRTAMRVLEYLGDKEKAEIMGGKLADMEKDIDALLSPRVDGEEKVCSGAELLGASTEGYGS